MLNKINKNKDKFININNNFNLKVIFFIISINKKIITKYLYL